MKPYLLYENSYEGTPGHVPKDPTVSQVPTEIGGALSMTIFNAGQTAIQVGTPSTSIAGARFDCPQDAPIYL